MKNFNKDRLTKYNLTNALPEKCPYLEFFWSVFSRIWIEYGVSLRIQSECGKTQTRKTPNKDTFHAVMNSKRISQEKNCEINTFVVLVYYYKVVPGRYIVIRLEK